MRFVLPLVLALATLSAPAARAAAANFSGVAGSTSPDEQTGPLRTCEVR